MFSENVTETSFESGLTEWVVKNSITGKQFSSLLKLLKKHVLKIFHVMHEPF